MLEKDWISISIPSVRCSSGQEHVCLLPAPVHVQPCHSAVVGLWPVPRLRLVPRGLWGFCLAAWPDSLSCMLLRLPSPAHYTQLHQKGQHVGRESGVSRAWLLLCVPIHPSSVTGRSGMCRLSTPDHVWPAQPHGCSPVGAMKLLSQLLCPALTFRLHPIDLSLLRWSRYFRLGYVLCSQSALAQFWYFL